MVDFKYKTELEQWNQCPRIRGFAPGGYVNECLICNEKFIGDKRAYNCLPCVISMINEEDMK